ncbi:unknown protein [Seminavis robusta]|uniref:Uncharacterized protein n=1 Tax=Seminavis robusta TaxID=568900 RepID=A0A9N8H301_9STRA|nr:unknown protein [Seminavis robusta]|eukprot:Sro77_g041900.1 n/a (210) ;mRNA; f:17939-18665
MLLRLIIVVSLAVVSAVEPRHPTTLQDALEMIVDLQDTVTRLQQKMKMRENSIGEQIFRLTKKMEDMETIVKFNTADLNGHAEKLDTVEATVADLQEHRKLGTHGHRELASTLEAVIAKTACISDTSDETKLWLDPNCISNLETKEYPCFDNQASVEAALGDVTENEQIYGPIYYWCFEPMSFSDLISTSRDASHASFNETLEVGTSVW